MYFSEFDKNVRFSYFLPFGFIGTTAFDLSIANAPDARVEYSPDIPMDERIASCQKAKETRYKAIRAMEAYGYIECVKVRYGQKHWEEVRLYRITRSGLYVLTNTPDPQLEDKRRTLSTMPINRRKKEDSYLPTDKESSELREYLFSMAQLKDTDPFAASDFDNALLESVFSGDLSILASEPYLATTVDTWTHLKGSQLYRAFRIANINALFLANGFITSIDRRPMDSLKEEDILEGRWGAITEGEPKPIDGLPLEEEPKCGEEVADRSALDIQAFCRETLDRWYAAHADSHRFLSPGPCSEEELRRLTITPTFYEITSIPGLKPVSPDTEGMNPRGSLNSRRRTFSGVALGVNTTYMMYHSRPVKTPWSETNERSAIQDVEKALSDAAEVIHIHGAQRKITDAIIVCPTVHQFASLFTMARSLMPKRWRKEKRVGLPYNSVCIVPVNHSGKIQLRGLMMTSPGRFNDTLVDAIAKNYPDKFSKVPDLIYQLSYNKTPVLVAYSMNFQQLYTAWDQYQEGKRFYVLCYPEQTKFIQKIMPEVTFL